MAEKRTWKLPEPPGVGIEMVMDEHGWTFDRVDEEGWYWSSDQLGPGRGTYHWAELLHQRGPVTEVRES